MTADPILRGDVRHEPICGFCGHGADLHAGSGRFGRLDGWCVACDERRADPKVAKFVPMCWWLTP